MANQEFDLTEPDLDAGDLLVLEDEHFGMTPVEVANLFVFGFSSHGRHLNGGDLLWDGGFTTTYE